jgi:SAM-dependent methyltransferase
VLDVGCGTGRHAHELARRGIAVHGIDISQRFVDLASAGGLPLATFERADARSMAFESEFEAVICLCQGAFGMMTADGEDAAVVAGMARALRPGGRTGAERVQRLLRGQVPRRCGLRRSDRCLTRDHRDPIGVRRGALGRPLDRVLHAS